MNDNRDFAYVLSRTRDAEIARTSASFATMARRELVRTRHGRRRQREWARRALPAGDVT